LAVKRIESQRLDLGLLTKCGQATVSNDPEICMTLRQRHVRRLSGWDGRFAVRHRAGLIAMAGLLFVTTASAEQLSKGAGKVEADILPD
jgi:hypothetical protein